MNSATASSTPSIPRNDVPASAEISSVQARLAGLKIVGLTAEKLTSPIASSESTEGGLTGEIARFQKIDVTENRSPGAVQEPLRPPAMFKCKAQIYPNTFLDFETRNYGATLDYYLTVSGITGISANCLSEKTGIAPFKGKISLIVLESFFETVNYSGNIIGFRSAEELNEYLRRAVEKAPTLILKLILGYTIQGEDARICMIKAWASQSKSGAPLFVKIKPAPPDDMTSKPRMHQLLVDYTNEGTPIKRPDSLFTLPPCKEFWLYETGKRYRSAPQ